MDITFIWPSVLWALAVLPALAGLYGWQLRRPSAHPITFTNAEALLAAAHAGGLRRHLPAGLLLAALAAAILTGARPMAPLPMLVNQAAVVLALDVSTSMTGRDIKPSRFEAAKEAADAFVKDLPAAIPVGIVSFSGHSTLVVPVTSDRARIARGLASLRVADETAIGEGLLEAVDALVPPAPRRGFSAGQAPAQAALRDRIVVLLSDGLNNSGIDPLRAADVAHRHGVRVFTIGMAQASADRGKFFGNVLDEETLQTVASLTGGTYYHVSSAPALRHVYETLSRSLGWERRPQEVSAFAAAFGAVALLAGLLSSRLFTHRIV